MSSTLRRISLLLRLRVLEYEHGDYSADTKRGTPKAENAKSRDSKLFGAVSQNSDYKIEHREKCDISDEIGNCEAFL